MMILSVLTISVTIIDFKFQITCFHQVLVTAFQGLCDSSDVVAPEFGICYIGMLMATVFMQVGYAVPYEGILNEIPPLDEWEEPQWNELQDQLTEIRNLCQRMDCRSTSLTAREDVSDGPWARHSSFHDDFDNILADCQLHAKVSKTRSELKGISLEFDQRTFDPHREKKLSHIVYVIPYRVGCFQYVRTPTHHSCPLLSCNSTQLEECQRHFPQVALSANPDFSHDLLRLRDGALSPKKLVYFMKNGKLDLCLFQTRLKTVVQTWHMACFQPSSRSSEPPRSGRPDNQINVDTTMRAIHSRGECVLIRRHRQKGKKKTRTMDAMATTFISPDAGVYDEEGHVRNRTPYSDAEDKALLSGFNQFGKRPNLWQLIKDSRPEVLRNRTGVQLKDRYRTLVYQGIVPSRRPDCSLNTRTHSVVKEEPLVRRDLTFGRKRSKRTLPSMSLSAASPARDGLDAANPICLDGTSTDFEAATINPSVATRNAQVGLRVADSVESDSRGGLFDSDSSDDDLFV